MTTNAASNQTKRIRALNDAFRRTFVGGAVMITAGVEALPAETRGSVLAKVRAFEAFTIDNDVHGGHDFGAVVHGGVRCFWKIDYYDREMEMHSADPADPSVTMRVLKGSFENKCSGSPLISVGKYGTGRGIRFDYLRTSP